MPDYPSVELKNPEGNFVDMVFTLTDEATGEIIARTGKVPAGKFAYVDVMKFYTEPGVYTVLINVATFDAQTGAQMNGIRRWKSPLRKLLKPNFNTQTQPLMAGFFFLLCWSTSKL